MGILERVALFLRTRERYFGARWHCPTCGALAIIERRIVRPGCGHWTIRSPWRLFVPRVDTIYGKA